MTKEKLLSLYKYLGRLEERRVEPISKKHAKHPKEFKQFIEREISLVKKKISQGELEVSK